MKKREVKSAKCQGSVLVFVALAVMACDVEGTLLTTERAGSGPDGAAVGVLDAGSSGEPRPNSSFPPAGVISVEAGRDHTCVLRQGGDVVCWGTVVQGAVPQRVSLPRPVTQHSGGEDFHCARDEAGAVFCFGINDLGQLGAGDFSRRSGVSQVQLAGPARSVSAGGDHACAVLEDGSLHCWGNSNESILGFSSNGEPPEPSPVQVQEPADWSAVVACSGHTCALDATNALYCWGRNSSGQAGQQRSPQVQNPTRVGTDNDWQALSCRLAASCGLRGRDLFCWGAFHLQDTSRGPPVVDRFETPRARLEGLPVTAVSAHTFTTCAVDSEGELYCWGRGIEGQLGLGDNSARSEPTQIPSEASVVDVSVGWFHTCVVYATGDVACTGDNRRGQLGTGDLERRAVLTAVRLP